MNASYPLYACIGPVSKGGFELKLDTLWWKYLFNATYNDTSLYLKTDGDVVEDPEITQIEIDIFSAACDLQKEDKILDLCCGQGRHTLELARRGYTKLDGLDFSSLLLSTAKSRCIAQGFDHAVTFTQGEASHLPYSPATFDKVLIMGNSIGYFAAESEDLAVLREAGRVLKKGGKLLVDVCDGDFIRSNFQPRSWEWVDDTMFVCREREMASDGERLISREIITLTDKGVIKDQFYSERLHSLESLSTLLRQAGFSSTELHKQLSSDSKRGQDLGLMEQRLVIIATMGDSVKADSSSAVPHVSLTSVEYPSEVFDSNNGKGIRATRDIRIGEIVERFTGTMVSFDQVPPEEKPFVVWARADLWLIPTTTSRWINHSCDPNCALNTNREIVARRPVKKGTELTISYNVSTESGPWDPAWTFECKCGARTCQRLIDRYVDLFGNPFPESKGSPAVPRA